ncbi:MAG: DUF4157 domain-containing protein [Dehalococcoidia bacterium]
MRDAAPSRTTATTADAPTQRLAPGGGPASADALRALQHTAGNRAVQRLVGEQTGLEEEPVEATPSLFNVPDATLPPPGGGQAIPDGVRQQMEGALGHDFSDVRVHVDSAPDSVGALAYTQGSDIHFRPGEYQPDSTPGREALGHELTHVVQQRSGRVASPQGLGAPVNADPALEAEADALGRQAARAAVTDGALAAPEGPATDAAAPAQRIAGPVQRLTTEEELAALREQQIVTNTAPMFEQGGGGAAAQADTSDDDAPPAAPADLEGGAQAVADATPATDSDTGAPEGAEEAVTTLGKDAAPMADALEEMASAVGPDEVIATLQAEFEAEQDEGEGEADDQGVDLSGMASAPSDAAGIAAALDVDPSEAAPALMEAAVPQAVPAGVPQAVPAGVPQAVPVDDPIGGGDGATQTEEWSDFDLDAIPTRGRSGAVTERPGAPQAPTALNVAGGDTSLGTAGEGAEAGSVLSSATGMSATTSQSLLGGSAYAAGQTAMISGGTGGILGGGAALIDAGQSAGRAHVSSGAAMAEEGARSASGLTGAAASASNAAVGIEAARIGSTGLSDTANAVMTGAGTAAAGLAVATGSIDVIRGVGGAVSSASRASRLGETATAQGDTEAGRVAAAAAETQSQRAVEGGITAGKGALSVAGGAVLLALGLTNPVGLGLLAGAALVGGAYALYKLWRSKRKKNAKIGGGTKVEGEAKAELAATLYARGIADGDAEYQAILVQLGFDAAKVTSGPGGGISQAHILSRVS